nr:hypothetical protein Q903MT_gene3271 [Picea sitchensis]
MVFRLRTSIQSLFQVLFRPPLLYTPKYFPGLGKSLPGRSYLSHYMVTTLTLANVKNYIISVIRDSIKRKHNSIAHL